MTVTVAISTRDRPDALRRCLSSLMNGALEPDEIVVVDQSDGRDSREVVEAARREGAPVVYVHEPRGGLAVAQNLAVARAASELVAVTDDDCVPKRDWLATVVATLGSPEGPDVVAGRVLPLGPDEPGRFAVASRTSAVRRDFSGPGPPWDVGGGNNLAFRKEWFVRVGGGDERLGPGSPGQGALDMDLFYRLLRAGARIRYEPAALVYHERTSWEGRRARRYPYGHGMGAAMVFWLREGDRRALRILLAWLRLRTGVLLRGLARGQRRIVREELLVLGGTLAGIVHGLRSAGAAVDEERRAPGA